MVGLKQNFQCLIPQGAAALGLSPMPRDWSYECLFSGNLTKSLSLELREQETRLLGVVKRESNHYFKEKKKEME